MNPSDVAPYFNLAETYTFADKMFQTNQGPSFPAHQFIISGTSAPTAPGTPTANWFASENPGPPPANAESNTGCTAPPEETVLLIDPAGVQHPAYPCYEHPSLTDQFDTKQISWKYYTPFSWQHLDRSECDSTHVWTERNSAECDGLHGSRLAECDSGGWGK